MAYCKTVWLIDDEELSLYVSTKIIQKNEFSSEVRTFSTAREALEALGHGKETGDLPNFIFLDLNLPEANGWNFLQHFRKFPDEIRKKITVYILSSSIDEKEIIKSKIDADVRDFISKPLRKRNLDIIQYQNNFVRKLML